MQYDAIKYVIKSALGSRLLDQEIKVTIKARPVPEGVA